MSASVWGPGAASSPPIGFLNVKDVAYGAKGDGATDDTTAIQTANADAIRLNKRLWFPAGTYVYKPSTTLNVGDWAGEGIYASILDIDTSVYAGTIFRAYNSRGPREMQIKQKTLNKTGIALDISAVASDEFTGHFNISEVYIKGFSRAVNINNVFMAYFFRCRFETNTEGVYCAPVDVSGDNGYISTLVFDQCWAWQNNRNYYFNPALTSVCVTFLNGSSEQATGSAEQAYFNNIRNLSFIDFYMEGANTIPALRLGNVNMTKISGRINDTGGIVLGTNAEVEFSHFYAVAATDVVTGGNGTQKVKFDFCSMRASGNSAPTDFLQFSAVSTDYNGVSYKNHAQNHSKGITNETYSASITPNLRFGNTQYINVNNGTAFTINAPTNAVAGTDLTITIRNISGGALGLITWNAVYKLSAWTSPANGFSRSITFYYNGTNWVEYNRTPADVPN